MKKNTLFTTSTFLLSLITGVLLLWACQRGDGSHGDPKTFEDLTFPPSPVELMQTAQQLVG
ncbi:MAG: hypothetical protein HQM14_13025 [SAR324 cluster bacterium]|nr:hypothetical protein [SAR324 cluster bacterium]